MSTPANTSNAPAASVEPESVEPAPDFVEQDFPETLDDAVPTHGYSMAPLVGLGGSAGSIAALQAFFSAMPADSGMAFVVILHLSPEHESTMAELLQRTTRMSVVQAENDEKIEADCVYVIPPGKYLSSVDEHLRLTDLHPCPGKRVAVDLFFRTLADSHGPHAVAIVLSGADGDGAIGIKRIKERGGLTIAQDPEEAEHASMPRSAIETGMVDWVLRVAQMPQRLLDYRSNEGGLQLPPEEGPQPAQQPKASESENEHAFNEVMSYLQTRTGRDFSCYKRATILRRLARRMQVNGTLDMEGYLGFLRTHPGEAMALLQDLLISVTNFFRDRDSFKVVEAVIPALFEGKGPTDAVRIWVPGCATGEEAYSLAILLCEYTDKLQKPPLLQIFATDLDEDAIRVARNAVYPGTISADVSEERLKRFFVKKEHSYRIRQELRELVLFTMHDALKDSPFSRLDLISCRNLLIYLNRAAQARMLDTFHFALRPGARLFLGSSESIEDGTTLFSVIDKKHRLFQQRPVKRTSLPVPSISNPAVPSSSEKLASQRLVEKIALAGRSFQNVPGISSALQTELEVKSGRSTSWSELHFKLLEQLAPPSVIVNQQHEIQHLSEKAGQFLQMAGGEPTMNLLRLVHPMLRIELRSALYRAKESGAPAEASRIPMEVDGIGYFVNLKVAAARELETEFFLVTFDARKNMAEAGNKNASILPDPAFRHLERELEQMKGHLRDTVEQYEASTEELKASNEELQAMNEELRSATEELETSREELLSINEELSTVNLELKSNMDQLGHAHSDMQNLMAATAIPTVFLNRDLCIMLYTPASVKLFHLISSDIGRPLTDLKHRLNYPELLSDTARVLAELIPIEREVTDETGSHWFLTRLLPYRTIEDRIGGVVLTLVNITEQKRVIEALRESEERYRALTHASSHVLYGMNPDWTEMRQLRGGSFLADTDKPNTAWLEEYIHPDDRPEIMEAIAEAVRKKGTFQREHRVRQIDGSWGWAFSRAVPLFDAAGGIVEWFGAATDVTERKRAELALENSREELLVSLKEIEDARQEAEAAGRAKDHFLAILSHELRTPLTPIMMIGEMLLKRIDLSQPVRDGLETIGRNVELEADLIDDLLDVTRISRDKLELEIVPLDLHGVIKHAIEITESDIRLKEQQLAIHLDAGASLVRGDFTRLQQVFWNLLQNASKFTPPRGRLRIISRNESGSIVVEISDNGRGIEPEMLPHLFEAFRQGSHSITREFGGLGLGLAISKAIADGHDGKLTASSPGIGLGAFFSLELPLFDTP